MNPAHTDPVWVKAIARAAWARRVTIGGSADDAGIGDLNTRQVLILNPRESYDSDIFAWFAKYYPGVSAVGIDGRTPDELAAKVKQQLGL
jgi:methylmalonyl-CoA mutase N-terminal domain/subunit